MSETVASGSGSGSERYCPTCEKSFATTEQRCPADGTQLVSLGEASNRLIGASLDGRYTILQKLGAGGMGTVYRATQHSVGREVAVKVVSPTLVTEPVVIKRFLREAKLASRFSHPNAVAVLDFGQTTDGLFYLVMELLAGHTLDHVLRTTGRLGVERAINIASQICDALDGAHQLQIVHRDLKPANVVLMSGAGGRDLVKVLDFGLAKSLSADGASMSMTRSGALLGTPAFMPPELAQGKDADARADLYSLGCILYFMLSGKLPFIADSVHELVDKHAHQPPPPLANAPTAIAAVVMKLLAKQPDDRFATATEVHRALDAARGERRFVDITLPGGTADAMFAAPDSGTRAAMAADSANRTPPAAFDSTASPDSATSPALKISESVLAEVAPVALRRGRTGAIDTDRAPAVGPRPTVKAGTEAPATSRRTWIAIAGAAVVVAAGIAVVAWIATRDVGTSNAPVATPLADVDASIAPAVAGDAATSPAILDASIGPRPPTDASLVEPRPDARRRRPRPDARHTPPATDAAIRSTPRHDATPF